MSEYYVRVSSLETKDQTVHHLEVRLATAERDKQTLHLAVREVWGALDLMRIQPKDMDPIRRRCYDALYEVMHG